jgi:ElaA protein
VPEGRSAAIHRARFDDLTPRDLYDILRLRSEIFVVEQDCVFLEPDGRDAEPGAEHLWARDEHGIAVALRILDEGDGVWSIGRVVARRDVRGTRAATDLMDAAIEVLDERGWETLRIKAQSYLEPWYARFGFAVSGPEFVEDGIPHVPMERRRERSA